MSRVFFALSFSLEFYILQIGHLSVAFTLTIKTLAKESPLEVRFWYDLKAECDVQTYNVSTLASV